MISFCSARSKRSRAVARLSPLPLLLPSPPLTSLHLIGFDWIALPQLFTLHASKSSRLAAMTPMPKKHATTEEAWFFSS